MTEHSKEDRYQQRQQKIKAQVDARIDQANIERGQILVITGNGKGKSTAGFGVITRATGHGQRCAVAQFIKGNWACGERNLLSQHGVPFYVMATGFTWETQNKDSDTQAAQVVWQNCKQLLTDESIDVVLLDEMTYMVNFGYIDLEELCQALSQRPAHQSVVITGRACHRRLLEIADTVSEVKNVKHGFEAGLKARQGIDW
ncbi:Corrinoid adenosyltransferase [Vibrio stylophorae]|uniref:Corrinoid adenosyltransferase n=1 Tax=Vibrio stylophorae TaxID=659351 RepID=A0ABM8ZS02_9VIBR|nr:cob(I)yrinic acid a,c-diamide adenosyltransferase [Vibrio stylophorae]CAH0533076.1 Corrinoid adenosyltransferase [Vibrio stylophorae]